MADEDAPLGRRRAQGGRGVRPLGGALARRADCASWPGSCTPPPSHHGHVTVDGSPPRFETSWPVPRQGAQGLGSVSDRSSVAAIGE